MILCLGIGIIAGFAGIIDLIKGAGACGVAMLADAVAGSPLLQRAKTKMPSTDPAYSAGGLHVVRGVALVIFSVCLSFAAGELQSEHRHKLRTEAIIAEINERSKKIREQAERDVSAQAWRGREGQR